MQHQPEEIILIGIAGPSGAGKSTATEPIDALNPQVLRIKLDDYFNDIESFPKINGEPNWEVPQNLNFDMLFQNLSDLKAGKRTEIRTFNKATHKRMPRTVEPKPVVLVEGFLLFYDKRVRDLFDIKIYIDIPEEVQLQRRMKREVPEREPYIKDVVIPHYRTYGVPTKQYADIVLNGEQTPEELQAEIEKIIAKALET